MERLRIAGLCGVIAPIFFTVLVIIAALLRPDYSHVAQFISELGASGTSNAIIVQTNFIITGLLFLAFAVGLMTIGGGKLLAIGSGFVVVMGVGTVGAGVFSCDPGCAGGTLTNQLHAVAATIWFASFLFAPILVSRGLRKDSPWLEYRSFSLVIGIIYIVAFILGFGLIGTEWMGASQRLQVGIFLIWIEIMAIGMLRQPRQSK